MFFWKKMFARVVSKCIKKKKLRVMLLQYKALHVKMEQPDKQSISAEVIWGHGDEASLSESNAKWG